MKKLIGFFKHEIKTIRNKEKEMREIISSLYSVVENDGDEMEFNELYWQYEMIAKTDMRSLSALGWIYWNMVLDEANVNFEWILVKKCRMETETSINEVSKRVFKDRAARNQTT